MERITAQWSPKYTIFILRYRTFCLPFVPPLCQSIFALCSCSSFISSIIFHCMNLFIHFTMDLHCAFKLHFLNYLWGWMSFHMFIVLSCYYLLCLCIFFLLFVLLLNIYRRSLSHIYIYVYILTPSSLMVTAVNIFSQCIVCLFIIFMIIFDEKFLNLFQQIYK